MWRGETGGVKRDEVSWLHSGKEWKSGGTGNDKENGGSDEKDVAHWRKIIQAFEGRLKMFIALCVALYGLEIWGWNDERRLNNIKRRYIK